MQASWFPFILVFWQLTALFVSGKCQRGMMVVHSQRLLFEKKLDMIAENNQTTTWHHHQHQKQTFNKKVYTFPHGKLCILTGWLVWVNMLCHAVPKTFSVFSSLSSSSRSLFTFTWFTWLHFNVFPQK